MKLKSFLVLSSMLLCPVIAQARAYKAAGCGLGSLVIKDDGFMQVLAATTNATSGSQTFGITTGTSNCVPASKVATLKRQESFFVANMGNLSRETSQGSGETLKAFAEVLGCEASAYTEFSSALKANHRVIFSRPGANASLDASKSILRAKLGTQCKDLI
jgi:hypothetical protein